MSRDDRPPLPDQAERTRFRDELEQNFSVIAPAGVGKTTGIVDRVLAIAEADADRPDPVLPRLVVVTYTKKAADEMFSRVRTELDRGPPHRQVHAHLAQAFFGTIHSFCQRVLRVAGPLCGLPSETEVATDTVRLWQQFRLEGTEAEIDLPDDLRRAFALHGLWEDVFALAEHWPATERGDGALPGLPPRVDGGAILELRAKGTGAANLLLSQERFRRWAAAVAAEAGQPLPLPCPEPAMAGSSKPLVAAWRETFGPLRRWREGVTRYLASAVAADYARYRRRSAQLTFDDLIGLARAVLRDPQAREVIRARGWRVILDEAQDTDPVQFEVLTELARPRGAEGCWIEGAAEGPRPGFFCMVGDPQQSIYSERADLGRYQQVHERLLAEGGEGATFSVTMRCPVSVVGALNRMLPRVLEQTSEGGQVAYVPLDHPVGARTGQILRLRLPSPDGVEANAPERTAAYASAFAAWWAARTREELGVASWNEVAILCPRKGWLDRLGEALQLAGVPARLLSRRSTKAGDPVHAWFAALLTIFARPRDSFELYGVLRDVFGCSDDALARRSAAGELRLDRPPPDASGEVGVALAALHAIGLAVAEKPLFAAVEYLLDACDLAARLALLPSVNGATIAPTLGRLRHEAARAEARQETLATWALQQRRSLEETLEGDGGEGEAVSLITAHKSKGLGFKVVVLPFFFRRFSMPPDRYPCLDPASADGLRILFSGDDRDEMGRVRAEQRRHELHERLLYVALTRVKGTLLLLDDAAWWTDLKHQRGESWAQLMRVEDEEAENRGAWLKLPTELGPPEVEEEASVPTPATPPAVAEVVRERLPAPPDPSAFWHRLTPSSLQLHAPETARAEPDQLTDERFPEEVRALYREDPAAYGNWWHDMMEHAPWSLGEDPLRLHFAERLKVCPDPSRGVREVERFLASELWAELADPAGQVLTEVPFLFGATADKVGYEGYIDLLALDPATGGARVVDWKTDRMPGEDPMKALLEAYQPQVAIYAKTLEASLEGPVKAGLYSTVSCAWVELA